MRKFILASQSPRRKKILEDAGYNPIILSVEISENINENLSVSEAIQTVAQDKARAVLQTYAEQLTEDCLVLSADTVVVHKNKILGKPQSQNEAKETLRTLSGDKHQVISAFCLYLTKQDLWIKESCFTTVSFRELNEDEIESYVMSGEPMDKAGSYGIQGAGGKFVDNFEGSWTNVVGLPFEKLEPYLKKYIVL